MATGTRRAGELCWINMLTPRPDEARAFFGSLLGWTFFEMPGLGHGIKVDGHDIGGLFDVAGPNTPKGTQPVLGIKVRVESADATRAKVESLGGTARPPFDIMTAGRMTVCFDPNGAQFDVWEPKAMRGFEVDAEAHGAPSWIEAVTTDVARAAAFYSALFGWTAETVPGSSYTDFKLGTEYVAGMTPITPGMRNRTPHWATYFTVTDVEQSARDAVKLGASLHAPLREVPGVGRFCGFTSPQGVDFSVIQYAP